MSDWSTVSCARVMRRNDQSAGLPTAPMNLRYRWAASGSPSSWASVTRPGSTGPADNPSVPASAVAHTPKVMVSNKLPSAFGSSAAYSTNSKPSVPIGLSALTAATDASCGNGPMAELPDLKAMDIQSQTAQCVCK